MVLLRLWNENIGENDSHREHVADSSLMMQQTHTNTVTHKEHTTLLVSRWQ